MEILVVDDDPIIRHVMVLQLDKLGYKADTAANGIEALRRVHKHRYSLVLMDLQMPDMNGYEATAAIRSDEKARGFEPMPILAHSGTIDFERCKDAGMNECLEKPVLLDRLSKTLSRYLPERCGCYQKWKQDQEQKEEVTQDHNDQPSLFLKP